MRFSTILIAGLIVSLVFVSTCSNTVHAAATNLNWTGGGAAGVWNDANNWDGINIPSGNAWQATFPNGTGNITFNDPPASLNKLVTGDGKITFNSGATLTMAAGTSFTPNANLNIGTGGFQTGGTVTFTNGGNTLSFAGDFKAPAITWGNSGSITQTGGAFDVTSFLLPINVANFPIGNWVFAGTSANTIYGGSTSAAYSFKMTGTPTTIGSTRINYVVQGGGEGVKWDLNGQSMIANQIDVQGYGTPWTRYAYLTDTLGGTIDSNKLIVASSNYAAAFLDLHGTNVTLRGSGVIYENRSQDNNGTQINIAIANGGLVTPVQKFDITDNTTFKFDPAAGSADIDTGSTDSGLAGFTDNFAFHNVTIATGDTIRLVGNQNVGGSANNALYVGGTLRGETNSTLNLNTRNAYVDGGLEIGNSAGKFTVSGGNLELTSNATAHFEVNGAAAGTEYDQLVFTGTGSISLNNATLDLDINALAPGIYTLIDNQTSNPISGTFLGLADGSPISTGNPQYSAYITYFGNAALGQMFGGNDFMLQISFVPEPSSAMLLGFGLIGLSQVRRKRRVKK